MASSTKRMRFAHCDGHTDVTFVDDGSHFITCGQDGDIRIWEGFDDDDPVSHRVGDEATAIAYKDGKIYVGTDLHAVQIYTYPAGLPDGLVSRFSANVTSISVSKDGSTLASGSCDMTIKVTNLKTLKDLTLQGHSAPILAVSMDSKGEFLASSSCDGTVKLWSLKENGKEVASFPWAPRSNDFSNASSLCKLHFEPIHGSTLAVPFAASNTVKLLERGTWRESGSFTDERLKDVSVCCWSPSGQYLAAATSAGQIIVWDVLLKREIFHFRHEKMTAICALTWNPQKGAQEIIFCDVRGQLGVLENFTTGTKSSLVDNDLPVTDFGDDIYDEAEISITQIKHETGFIPQEDGDVFAGLKKTVTEKIDVDAMIERITTGSGEIESSRKAAYPQIKLQEPFQPGSSPAHLQHRYMMWNSVGIVRSFTDDDSESSIDVEFHDTSVHHALHIPNSVGYSMAALSNQALVLASEAQTDSPSKLSCFHFASWDGQKEWVTSLPEGEEAVAVGVGETWVAVATTRRLLRFFTLTGLQRGLVGLPGSLVCMSGHSQRLLLVFHSGIGAPGEQNLTYGIITVDRKSPVGYEWSTTPQSLFVGQGCSLSWAGFTDEGTPTVMDSSGLISLQVRGLWMPILDTKQHIKGKSDHYFIVGLSETEQQLRCILCKGSRYPLTLPRPTLALVDLRLPLCDLTTEKGQQEEALLKASMLVQVTADLDRQGFDVTTTREAAEKSYKESLMKLFALSCQSEREVRAVEAAEWMTTEHMLQLAVKYATRARRRHLADKLTQLAEQKNDEALVTDINQSYDSYISNHSQPKRTVTNHEEDRDMFASQSSIDVSSAAVSDNPFLQARQQQQLRCSADEAAAVRPLSGLKKNPFAKAAVAQDHDVKLLTPTPKGSVIFDDPSRLVSSKPKPDPSKENNTNNKSKNSKQTTLFSAVAKKSLGENQASSDSKVDSADKNSSSSSPKTGFMLWFDQNKDQLKEENPQVADKDLTRLAAKQFKELPAEEREKYNRKRKLDDETQEAPDKRNKSSSAAERLSSFAFQGN